MFLLLVYYRKEREKGMKRKIGKEGRKEERKGNEGYLGWFPGSFLRSFALCLYLTKTVYIYLFLEILPFLDPEINEIETNSIIFHIKLNVYNGIYSISRIYTTFTSEITAVKCKNLGLSLVMQCNINTLIKKNGCGDVKCVPINIALLIKMQQYF